jgi:hypothetical protein
MAAVDHLSLNSLKDRHGPIRAPKSLKLESLISVRPHRLNPDEEGLLRPPTDPRNTVEESTS